MKKIQLSIGKNLTINQLIIDDKEEFILDNEIESFFYYFTPLTFMPAKDNFLFLKGFIVNHLSGELFHFKSGNTELFLNLFFKEIINDNFIVDGFVNEYVELNCSLKRFEKNQNLYNNNFNLFPLKIHSCSLNLNGFKNYSSHFEFFPEHLKIKNIADIYSFIDDEFISVFESKIELLLKKNIPLDIVYKLKKSNSQSPWYRTVLKFIPDLNCLYGCTLQIEKRTVDDYYNRVINKVFQKTELFYKSGHWYYEPIRNTVEISATLQKTLNAASNIFKLNEFLSLFISENYSSYFNTIFKNCKTNGADFEIELNNQFNENSSKWYKITGYSDSINSKIVGVFGTITDITDEKNYTLQIRESQKQFESILNHNLQGYILLDTNQKIISFNEIIYKSSIKYFNAFLEREKFILDCFTEIDKIEFNKIFEKCLKGKIIHEQSSFTDKRKKTEFFKTSYVPVFGLKNKVSKILIVVTNITDFKEREIELKELSIVASSISSGVYIVEKNHKIKWANQSYEKLIQSDLKSLKNKVPLILNELYTSKKYVAEIHQAINENKVYRNEINILRKNGSDYWASVTITPLFDEKNILQQYIVIEDDITDKKRAEEYKNFIDSQKKLREVREQKIRTLSVLIGQETERKKFSKELHEGIGQSLSAAKFALSGIKKYSDENSFSDKVNSIDKNLKDVIERIRKVSKDLSPSTLYDFGLNAAIEELISGYKKNSLIEFIYNSNLGNARLSLIYEVEIFRLVAEIVLNSIKHSNCKSIIIDVLYSNTALNITIADDGVGFEAKTIMQNANGLKNVKEIGRLIGARVTSTSRIGSGTIFSINLNFNK